MISLAGYTLTSAMVETPSSILHWGQRNSDGCRVMIRAPRSSYPSRQELLRLRNEYTLLRSLDVPEVVKAYDLQKLGNGLALVLEEVSQRSVGMLVGRPMEIGPFLEIAISMASVLQTLHDLDIIHKDVTPHHFYFVDDTRRLKLVDMRLATLSYQEPERAIGLDFPEGALPYMSPEQTGRMDRVVDRRSDQYSLGVTYYQLLTGLLPFSTADPLELMHSHIARVPPSPRKVRSEIPQVLSDIVMKLLSKVAEDRYHGITGVRADLQECQESLRGRGAVASFVPGHNDVSGELHIPIKLYGRETASKALLSAFTRAQQGASELLLISGHSGIGKSALVHQIQKLILRRGRFTAGKFDQLGRNVPYGAIAQACRELIRSLLTEAPAQIESWRQKLTAALGVNAQLMVAWVPELELVMGRQAPAPELGPSEAQHRFELVFQNFLRVFTSAAHPLALFLDDLQWADRASLRLLEVALTAGGNRHLLVIGAFRDSEIGPLHPLTLALEDLAKEAVPMSEIRLSPLGLSDVCQWLSDALGYPVEEVTPLAKMMLRKTDGNPFFLGQFLTTIHQDGLIAFDSRTRSWTWDVARMDAAMATDNVVDFMVSRLKRLSPPAQAVLRLAACIGHRFDRRTLTLVSDRSQEQVTTDLWDALRDGLVVPLGALPGDEGGERANTWYRFLHDRVQQAAYALIDDRRKQEVHLRIGRLLLASQQGSPDDEALFSIVSHLNIGAPLIVDPAKRRELARLDLLAGQRARDAAAHGVAVGLLATSLSLLGEDTWTADYLIANAAHLAKAECEFLRGKFGEAFHLLEVLENHAQTLLDHVPPRALRTTILTNLNRLPEALTCAVDTLRMLGMDIPEDPEAVGIAIGAAFGEVKEALLGRTIESLLDLPPMQDPEKLALIDVLYCALPSAYQTNPEVMALMTLKAIAVMLRHGNAPSSPYLYAGYGLVHLKVTADVEAAYRFGQLGIKLSERQQKKAVDGPVHFLFGAFLSHWRTHLSESVEHLRRGLDASMDAGDYIHAGYCSSISICYRFYMGDPLDDLKPDFRRFGELYARNGDVIDATMLQILEHGVASLQGQPRGQWTFDGACLDEEAFVQSIQSNRSLAVHYLLLKLIVSYFAGDYDDAIAAADAALPVPPGSFYVAERCLYRGLAVAAKLREAPASERPRLLGELREAEQTFGVWAEDCPGNHGHRHALLAAELSVATGKVDAANDLYDRAIALAGERGFVQHQALGNELCAKFHLARGRNQVARAYFNEAHYAYRRWGANPKAEEIAAINRELAPSSAPRPDALEVERGMESSRETTMSGRLDLATAIRATQAIASELDLGRVLDRLMRILVENAGAQRGLLVLRRGDRLEIAATATLAPDLVETDLAEDAASSTRLAASVVQYVARTREVVVLGNAVAADRFAKDPYVIRARPRSLLCLPLKYQGRVTGVLYLENNAATNAFNPAQVELLQFLAVQAAIAVENAKLYGEVRSATDGLRRANETLEQKVQERTRELSESNARLKDSVDLLKHMQRELMEASRKAGMAEVATGVLHNVGNVLNSINVSANLIADDLRRSKTSGLVRAADLLRQHDADRAHFLTNDAQGARLIDYLCAVADAVGDERTRVFGELELLKKNINHVNVIISMQQSHAKHLGVTEELAPSEVLEDALNLELASCVEQGIAVVRDFADETPIHVDRHKLLQIVTNLLANARHAVNDGRSGKRQITVSTRSVDEDSVAIEVHDTGLGIPAENLTQIFNLGFTTKKEGHGFGLHSSACAAIEMGGTLTAHSDGQDQGALFRLVLPIGGGHISDHETMPPPP